MHCNTFANRLDDYLDGLLDERAAMEMGEHETACAQCQELAAQARDIRDALSSLGREDPPEDLHERLMDAVRTEAKEHGKPRRRMNRWGIAGIAVAAVVVCLAVPLSIGLLGASTGGGMNAYSMDSSPYMAAGDAGGYAGYSAAAPQAAVTEEMALEKNIAYDDMAYDEAETSIMREAGTGGVLSSTASVESPESSGASHGLKLIRSGYITLETRVFDEDLAALRAMIDGYGGYIESSSVSGIPYNADPQSYGRWAHLSARIPSEFLDSFLSDAKGVGNVVDSSINAYDITSSYQDTELRLETLKTQNARLNELLAQAKNVEDLIAIESELSRVQYEIDSLSGTLRDWDNRVDYSSVNISLDEVKSYTLSESVDPTLGERLSEGFRKGLYSFVEGCQDFLVFIAASLPAIVMIAAAATGLYFLVRHLMRRRKAKKRTGDDAPPDFD